MDFMKIGRNDPCPCGSGKKYKKCCLLKEHGMSEAESFTESSDSTQDDPENFGDVDTEVVLGFLYTLHRMMLSRKPHIKEYEKIRKMHGEVLGSMMHYYEEGKFIPKANGDYSDQLALSYAKGELTMINADFDTDTKEGNQALADILVYKVAPNMNCITEEYINSRRFRKPEKVEFLQCMLDSRIGLFEVAGVDRNEGYAHLVEVFSGDKYKITDIGLCSNPNPERFYLYTRIITYQGISFNTGLNIIFGKTDSFIKDFIKRNKKDYKPLGELVRFTELYNRYSADSGRINTVQR